MLTFGPLATGLLEGTLLALLGVILFQLRHRTGLMPFIFLMGGLALTIPFTAHLTQLHLEDPWTISRTYAVVLPVFVTLVLLLHTFIGELEARMASLLPVLGGAFVAAATLASYAMPVVLPEALLPTPTGAVVAGAILSAAAFAGTGLFGIWHRHVHQASPVAVILVSGLAAVLLHGLLYEATAQAGLVLGGGRWPAIVAVPMVTGLAPVSFVAIYTEVLLDDLAPIARQARDDPEHDPRDLDRVREAEDRFRDALAWVQEAHDAMDQAPIHEPVGLFVASPEGRVLHVNDAMAWMLARPTEEMIGQEVDDLLAPDDPAEDTEPMHRAVDRPSGTHATTVRLPDCRRRHLEVSLTRTRQGAIRGEIRDRTVDQLREEAEHHRDRARFALDLLTRDVPNHLAAPRSITDALVDRLDDGAPATTSAEATPHETSLATLAERLDRSLDGVGALLDRVKPLRELKGTDPEPVAVDRLLHDAVDDLPPEALDRLSIRWKLPSGPLRARASPLLSVAFEEILDNARRHAGADARVTIAARRQAASWVVTIADDGPGVPDALKGRIFDGCRQGSDGRGAGLGLYLASAIVEAAGGTIHVEDRVEGQPDEGAAFQIRLPADGPPRVAEGLDVLIGPRGDDETAAA